MAGGIGGGLLEAFGGENDSKSEVGGPDNAMYQLPNQQQNHQALQNYMQTGGNVQAQQVQGQQMATGQMDQSRGQQQQLSGMLLNAAAGNGPTAAGALLQQSQEAQIAAARSAAASGSGDTNPFLAQRNADQQMQSAMSQGAVAQAAQRASEQQAAMGQAAGQLQGMRGQDIDASGQQANFNQQANLANQQAMLQQNAQNQQAQQFALSGNIGLDQQQANANMAYSQAQVANDQYNNSMNMGVAQQNAAAAGQYGQAAFQGAMSAASTAAMLSDERLKENVDRDATDHEMDGFLDALDPASYTYINPKHGEGRHWSVMAQSAAKTPVGRSFVVQTPDGLGLDTRKASAVALAALAHTHRRLNALEGKD